MTSSPDAAMCADIRNALTDSGCPLRLANELTERSTDKKWPNGLSTLPMRQLNRGECAKYVTKRIPGLFCTFHILHLYFHCNSGNTKLYYFWFGMNKFWKFSLHERNNSFLIKILLYHRTIYDLWFLIRKTGSCDIVTG